MGVVARHQHGRAFLPHHQGGSPQTCGTIACFLAPARLNIPSEHGFIKLSLILYLSDVGGGACWVRFAKHMNVWSMAFVMPTVVLVRDL